METLVQYVVSLVPLQEATSLLSQWQQLALAAVEQNPFFEPFFLIPDSKREGDFSSIQLLLVYLKTAASGQTLVGLAPVTFGKRFGLESMKVRVSAFTPVGTPLLHAEHFKEATAAILDWIDNKKNLSFAELPMISGDGPIHHEIRSKRTDSIEPMAFRRCLIVPNQKGFQEYFKSTVEKGSRRNTIMKRLAALEAEGKLEFEVTSSPDEISKWVSDYIELEKKGWKGRRAAELGLEGNCPVYFESIIRTGIELDKVMLIALKLDGVRIAMDLILKCGSAGFSFKITYDEKFKKLSPGIIRDLKLIQYMHETRRFDSLDSCSFTDNEASGELWSARRRMAYLLIPTKKNRSKTLLLGYKLFRKFKSIF